MIKVYFSHNSPEVGGQSRTKGSAACQVQGPKLGFDPPHVSLVAFINGLFQEVGGGSNFL